MPFKEMYSKKSDMLLLNYIFSNQNLIQWNINNQSFYMNQDDHVSTHLGKYYFLKSTYFTNIVERIVTKFVRKHEVFVDN